MYIPIQCTVYKATLSEYDHADALVCAAEDWQRDVEGGHAMNRQQFCDGLFELADLYTETVDAADYTAFLWRVLKAVAWKDDNGLRFWRELAEVQADVQMAAVGMRRMEAGLQQQALAQVMSNGYHRSDTEGATEPTRLPQADPRSVVGMTASAVGTTANVGTISSAASPAAAATTRHVFRSSMRSRASRVSQLESTSLSAPPAPSPRLGLPQGPRDTPADSPRGLGIVAESPLSKALNRLRGFYNGKDSPRQQRLQAMSTQARLARQIPEGSEAEASAAAPSTPRSLSPRRFLSRRSLGGGLSPPQVAPNGTPTTSPSQVAPDAWTPIQSFQMPSAPSYNTMVIYNGHCSEVVMRPLPAKAKTPKREKQKQSPR